MCLRDDSENFIRAKTHWYSPIRNVLLGETMGFFLAINWVCELGCKDVIFELDAKYVVDAFNSKNVFISEFGFYSKFVRPIFLFSFVTLMMSLL